MMWEALQFIFYFENIFLMFSHSTSYKHFDILESYKYALFMHHK